MDPVSAVGLASSILTFVEFAITLVAGSVTIYRSVDGALDENKELDKAINDLDYLSSFLDQRPVCKTEAESRIARIAKDCRADSKKLEDIIEHIANPKNKRAFWRSLKASWLSTRSRKDVTELKSRLQEYRSETLLQVTLLLREEQSGLSLGIAKIRDDCSQLKIGFRTDISNTRNSILEAISALNRPDGGEPMSDASLADISKMLLAIQTKVDETQLHHRILRQLVFKDMNSRANQIPKAAQDTFTWMLEDGPVKRRDERSRAWNTFVKWLRTGDKILFVSGNPGSGKSTLMKYLIQHERTKEELAVWAGSNKLICCVFYFWNSGSESQRTLTGLYRSLLFQSLSQHPQLIGEVFPLQIRRMKVVTGDTTVEEIQGFEEEQIEEAFDLLLDRASQSGYRLCFFIDGLDESQGNRLKHEELVLKLQEWTVSGTVKLCVSSRPYSEFIEPLSLPETQLIHLHKLNESDIRTYCINRFQNDMHARQRRHFCEDLSLTVVKRAQGVFLWVHLVIDVMLIGFRQADPDSILLARLQALPTDLDLLYTKLREPIEADSIQRDRSNRMLLLAAHNPSRYDLTAMAFSWLEDQSYNQGGLMNPDFPPPSKVKPYAEDEISKRIDRVTKQIDGLARGFLEVNTRDHWPDTRGTKSFFTSIVQFCHRTARDYLINNEDRHFELLKSFPNFEQSSVYIRIRLAEIIHGYDDEPKVAHHLNVFSHFGRSFRKDIDPDVARRFELPVRCLLSPVSKFLPSSSLPDGRIWRYSIDRVSFTEYAASCGLSRYVLREVTTDATKLSGTSSCGSVLLAAVKNKQCGLASELLRLSKGKTQLCDVWDNRSDSHSLVPACVLAFAIVFERIIGAGIGTDRVGMSAIWSLHEELVLAVQILKFCTNVELSLRITVVGVKMQGGDGFIFDEPKELPVQIDATDAIELLENIKLPEDGIVNLEVFGGRLLEKMSVERLGRALEEEVQTKRRFKEWPHDAHTFFSHGTKGQRLRVDKIEWASEGRDLVELKGWVRLY